MCLLDRADPVGSPDVAPRTTRGEPCRLTMPLVVVPRDQFNVIADLCAEGREKAAVAEQHAHSHRQDHSSR